MLRMILSLFLTIIIFLSMSCASSSPTPYKITTTKVTPSLTSTKTTTPTSDLPSSVTKTHTPDPTQTSSPTTTPLPSYSIYFPKISDLPAGSEDVLRDIGMNTDISINHFSLENSFAFHIDGGFNFIFGFIIPVDNSNMSHFQDLTKQTDSIPSKFLDGFGSLEVSEREYKSISENFGQVQEKMSRIIVLNDFLNSARANEICFIRDNKFVYVLEIHIRSEFPLINVEEISRNIDNRIQELQ